MVSARMAATSTMVCQAGATASGADGLAGGDGGVALISFSSTVRFPLRKIVDEPWVIDKAPGNTRHEEPGQIEASLPLARDHVQGKSGQAGLLVARLHVQPGQVHGADDLVEG